MKRLLVLLCLPLAAAACGTKNIDSPKLYVGGKAYFAGPDSSSAPPPTAAKLTLAALTQIIPPEGTELVLVEAIINGVNYADVFRGFIMDDGTLTFTMQEIISACGVVYQANDRLKLLCYAKDKWAQSAHTAFFPYLQ